MKRGRYNNVRILFISAIMFFSLLILFLASVQQKAQWSGKIEYKNGIEVIKKGYAHLAFYNSFLITLTSSQPPNELLPESKLIFMMI